MFVIHIAQKYTTHRESELSCLKKTCLQYGTHCQSLHYTTCQLLETNFNSISKKTPAFKVCGKP